MNTTQYITRHASLYSLLLILLAAPLAAQTIVPNEEAKARMNDQVRATMERLELTQEQQEVVRPIIENNMRQRLAVLEKHGIDPAELQQGKRPGMRTMRKLRSDMERLGKATEKQLGEVLTDDQMATWKALEEERRDQMRKQMRGS